MIDVCEHFTFVKDRDLAEDIFFSKHVQSIPEAEEASAFSVELVMHPDPCGMHQIWIYWGAPGAHPPLSEWVGPRAQDV
jgi:hypothetical protein